MVYSFGQKLKLKLNQQESKFHIEQTIVLFQLLKSVADNHHIPYCIFLQSYKTSCIRLSWTIANYSSIQHYLGVSGIFTLFLCHFLWWTPKILTNISSNTPSKNVQT